MINKIQDKRWTLTFFGIAILNLFFTYPRLRSGVPMGEDSTSHLFQVLYLYNSYRSSQRLPLWCSEWYCGFPFLLFYPPLSYFFTFIISMMGIQPILSYKIIESFFYIIAPFALYFLARTLNLTKREAFVAALAFSLTPGVVTNFIFWDRYPTIVATPLLILLSAFIIRYLRSGRDTDFIMVSLTFSFLLLIHHYSAYCSIIAATILSITYLTIKKEWLTLKRALKLVAFTGMTSFSVALFWVLPFLNFRSYLSNNPFTNGDVWDNYLPPEHWDLMLYKLHYLGLVQWLLATYTFSYFTACRIDDGQKSLRAKLICGIPSLFFLSAIFIQPFYINFEPAELLLLALVSTIVPILLISSIKKVAKEEGAQFIMPAVWFFLFAWLSFGSHALLFKLVPYWERLDTYRFSLYACIPECILIGKLSSLISSSNMPEPSNGGGPPRFSFPSKRASTFFVILLLVANLYIGFTKYNDFTYRYNDVISEGLVEYFKSQEDHARILAIECPDWIYLLPTYTGKPLLDGWYPQAKILPLLVNIDDYKLNELTKTYRAGGDEARIKLWRAVISNYSLLGVEWVVLPEENRTLNAVLLGDNKDFYVDGRIDGFIIYKAVKSQSLVQAESKILEASWRPDKITIIVETNRSTSITVKEAYFPEWTAKANASLCEMSKDDNGFIKILVTPMINSRKYRVELTYERPYQGYLYILSALTFFPLVVGYIRSAWRERRKWRLKNGT